MSKFVKLKNITSKIGSGATPRGGNNVYSEKGVAFVRSQNILDMSFSKTGLVFINDQQSEKLKGVTVESDDVLLNITGDSIARSCVVPASILPARVSQHVSIIRCKDRKSALFVNYYLHYLKPHLLQICRVGGTRNALTKEAIENLYINLPCDYNARAKVLSVLDAKIDCNNRINIELEAIAKTLYDYWFVQFNFPDHNGQPYKSSGGKMVYNSTLKRKIPAGWRDGSLWDIAQYYNGLPMQKFRPVGKDYLPVIKIKEMNDGLSENTEKASLNIPQNAIVNDGDVLFSWSATLDVKIWSQGKGALNQHIFKVTSEIYPKTFYYYELLNYLNHFKMMAEKRKTTMGHITQDHLKQSMICIPPVNLLHSAHQNIDPFFKKHLLNEKENQHLTQLRDWLLPMLMNGQVTVV